MTTTTGTANATHEHTGKVYLATIVDRAWHWIHALGIVLLVLTGMNIHFADTFGVLSFESAVELHNIVGIVVSFDWGLWFFYNLFSLRFRFYLPSRDELPPGLLKQAMYYGYGIFMGREHPFHINSRRKFNPLQKLSYLGVMFVLVPFQIVTGLFLYSMFTGYSVYDSNLSMLFSLVHYLGAIIAACFVMAHVYLTTTGHQPLSLLQFMITGWHDDEGP